MDFYYPACIDEEFGGYINQFRDDGSIFDRHTKHLVGTCRFIYNFSLSALLFGEDRYRDAAAHGLAFLTGHHRQPDGGFAWVLSDRTVIDPVRSCYGHAFALLAAAGATKAGVAGARALVDEIWDLLERRFWESDAQLYVDEIAAGDWNAVSPYRGQNCNMHMCEAMIAAYEATGERRFIDRAETIAHRICVDLSGPSGGLIWEHYTSGWQPDWDYNRDDPNNLFKPYGYLPGHFVEWAKLLVLLDRHHALPWHLPAAEHLFQVASDKAWDDDRGGMTYSFAPEGRILDTDRYYWVTCEAFASAALLALATGKEAYWHWYDRHWAYADRCFIDHKYGGWYRVLDPDGKRYSDEKSPPSKTDYHPLAACFETLVALNGGETAHA
ncbi:MAG: AGE family epimerase/isomerase [Bauldia sp.]|nr:AGE family epimerase/isomerase [Bauldia sp.]